MSGATINNNNYCTWNIPFTVVTILVWREPAQIPLANKSEPKLCIDAPPVIVIYKTDVCRLNSLISLILNNNYFYYTSDSLWKIWLVKSIPSTHNSLWTWHDKCIICRRYYIYHVKFNICLVTKPLGVFFSETKWLNASLLFLRINYVKNV